MFSTVYQSKGLEFDDVRLTSTVLSFFSIILTHLNVSRYYCIISFRILRSIIFLGASSSTISRGEWPPCSTVVVTVEYAERYVSSSPLESVLTSIHS